MQSGSQSFITLLYHSPPQHLLTVGALHVEVDQLHLVQERQAPRDVERNFAAPALLPATVHAAAPVRAASRELRMGFRVKLCFTHALLSDAPPCIGLGRQCLVQQACQTAAGCPAA